MFVALFFQFLFGYATNIVFGADNGSNNASLNFTITSLQSKYANPPNGNVQGRLDVTVTSQGRVDNIVRPPIDVVFLFDVSGSMTPIKLQSQNILFDPL